MTYGENKVAKEKRQKHLYDWITCWWLDVVTCAIIIITVMPISRCCCYLKGTFSYGLYALHRNTHTLLSFCHEHEPRLSIILQVSSASSPGFTSVYFGCSTNFWSPNDAENNEKKKTKIIICCFAIYSNEIFMMPSDWEQNQFE